MSAIALKASRALLRPAGRVLGLLLATALLLRAGDSTGAPPKLLEGISYTNDRQPNVPWSIHVLKIDRARTDLQFVTAHARGTAIGLDRVSEQVKLLPPDAGRPLAAINGDFYRTENEPYAGDPRGLQIIRGELVSAPTERTVFWIDAEGQPHIDEISSKFKITWPDGQETAFGLNEERTSARPVLYTPALGASTRTRGGRELVLTRDGDNPWLPLQSGQTYQARVREVREDGDAPLIKDILVLSLSPALSERLPKVEPGAALKISTMTSPDTIGAVTAVGGGPLIVSDGKVVEIEKPTGNRPVPYSQRSIWERHPRTSVGMNATHIFLVEVDGRQQGLSVGMTLHELGGYLAKLGCEKAMNLDGGASSELWLAGQVMNSPCHGQERPVANSLIVVRKHQKNSASREK